MSYNISQLRILWELALDGLKNENVVLFSTPENGDWDALNVKTDIVEQKYRTSPTQGGTQQVFLSFDCGIADNAEINPAKTVFIDTFAMIGTNLSPSAVVALYGYGDVGSIHPPFFDAFITQGTKIFEQAASPDPYEENFIWCSPEQPTVPYQHYLVEIRDPQNQDGFLEIGRVLGGQSTILTTLENFTDNFKYQEQSFIDEMEINGFTSIANQRALKKNIRLSFNKLNLHGDNWRSLRRLLRYVRTTKKCLVIPDSTDPYLMHLFGKVKEMPDYSVSFIDSQSLFADFELQIDEAR